jgi:hypothetical protein
MFLAACTTATTLLVACNGGTGASEHPRSDAPTSTDPGTTPTTVPGAVTTIDDGIVVVNQPGRTVTNTATATPLGVDEIPRELPAELAQSGGEVGAWLLDAGAAFGVHPSVEELSCLADLTFNDDEISDAIDGIDPSWARAADCLQPSTRDAIAVMRAMDLTLADASDDQYVCVEAALDLDRTPAALDRALDTCEVTS